MTLDFTTTEVPVSPSPDAEAFWEAADRGELVLPWCCDCNDFFWYPRSVCPSCGGRPVEWRPAAGTGTIYTFCITHNSGLPHLRDRVPFVTGLIDLDEGPRIMGFIDVDPDPAGIEVGGPVTATFLDTAGPHRILAFVPVT